MRFDLQVIASFVDRQSRVLDLGCGNGELLSYLINNHQVEGTGIDQDEAKVASCIEQGLSVMQGDINEEIRDYPDKVFDYVILSQTLQQVYQPARLIREILRIGAKAIVSFPNFGHWNIRAQLLFKGWAPISKSLPYQWHDTPNIRVITIKDFRRFAREVGFNILQEVPVKSWNGDDHGKIITRLANLRAPFCIFLIGRETGAGGLSGV